MYLFIYKTTHKNGKYYIGRHETTNINDGYLGSGNWVRSIKDKSTLFREIIAEATTFDELSKLEEYHISLHYDNPSCMNYKRGGIGWNSEDVQEQLANGTHIFSKGKNPGPAVTKRLIEAGTHNFVVNNPVHKQIKEGTHVFTGGEIQRSRVAAGTHNFQGDNNPVHKLLAEGTHNFILNNPGGAASRSRVVNGSHNFQTIWTCPHCGVTGKGTSNYARWHGNNCKSFKILTNPI